MKQMLTLAMSLIFSLSFVAIQAQNVTVKGKVLGEDGFSVPGATVVVKGTTIGTTTDFEGNYTLTNVPADGTLTFSFIGMATQDVAVNGQTSIDITLMEEAAALEEVVVIGYGTVKKEEVTTSISKVDEEDFNPGAVTSPEDLIQGKAAGIQILTSNGEPGAGVTVRIRGGKSITASNDPLYIIDGVPINNTSAVAGGGIGDVTNQSSGNPLAFMNPNDIESISILKDAAAAAIYGSRGANGVILITTKKGKSGEPKISYNHLSSMSWSRKKYDIYSADELRNLKTAGTISFTDNDPNASTNWQDEILRNAYAQSHNVSLSGGSEKTSYRASLSYSNTDGILKKSDLERVSGRINATQSAFDDKLKLNLNLTVSTVDKNIAGNEQNGGFQGGLLNGMFNHSPTQPIRNTDGTYTRNGTFFQPVATLDHLSDQSSEIRVLGNFETKYKFFEFLTGTINLGFDRNEGQRNSFVARSSQINPLGAGFLQDEVELNKIFEAYFTFDKEIAEGNNLQVTLGTAYEDFSERGNGMSGEDLLTNTFTTNNFAAYETQNPSFSYLNEKQLSSYYGRVLYSHQSKYIIQGQLRIDGSSVFGQDNKYLTAPGISVAWRASEEDFVNEGDIFDNLKLKFSYGVIGNQAITPYQSLATLSPLGSKYKFGDNVITPYFFDNYANNNLKWETTSTFNVGVEWAILDRKLSGEFEYYSSQTKDLLLRFTLPQPADPATILANVGEVANSGFEGLINYKAIEKDDLALDFIFNFATLKNEVKSLANEIYSTDKIYYGPVSGEGQSQQNILIATVGQPLHSFYTYEFNGLNSNGEETFKDLNGDGEITDDDRKVVGNAQPNFLYGLTGNLKYKRFNVRAFFRGISGIETFNNTELVYGLPSRLQGRNAIKGGLEAGESITAGRRPSTRFIENASFLRLENFTIGYSFDTDKIDWLSSCKLSLTGQNLFVISKYNGLDPEVNTEVTANDIPAVGIDYNTYPKPTTISLGLNVTF